MVLGCRDNPGASAGRIISTKYKDSTSPSIFSHGNEDIRCVNLGERCKVRAILLNGLLRRVISTYDGRTNSGMVLFQAHHKSSERISHSPHTFGLIPFQSHFHSSKRLTLGRQKGAMSRLLGVVCSPFFQKKGAVNIHFFMSNKFYLADHFSSRKITR